MRRVPDPIDGASVAAWLAALVAAIGAALSVRFGTFVPWGTDAGGYVEAAYRWADGRLAEPSPLALWASWVVADGAIGMPLGFRPGLPAGTDVSEYPAGLPLLMAAALRLAGDAGPYLVAPFCCGLLVWCTFDLARRLGGPWGGLLAAVLAAASPLTLVMAVQPMSDVPATALWLLALAMALRTGVGAAAACGAAASLAMLVRPNLAPFAIIVGLLVLLTHTRPPAGARGAWAPVVVAAAAMTAGPLLVMWTSQVLYGSPFESSYWGGWNWMFSTSYIAKNLGLAPGFLVALHSPLAFAGLLTPLLVWRPSRLTAGLEPRRVAVTCVLIGLMNYLLYLTYLPYDDPHFLRFQMPAVMCLFVLLAGLSAWLWRRLRAWGRPLAPLALIPAVVVLLYPRGLLLYPLTFQGPQTRVVLMGRYLATVLPAEAVVLTHLHGGAMAHYTNRPVVRLDRLPADALDRTVADLVAHGHEPVLLVGEEDEIPALRARFPSSPLVRLDWAPRARALSTGGFAYFRIADQARYAAGERWPVDVLRPPG